MNSFLDEQINILVCTSIIESGLDMTNVNTIIINNAQNFGLSQLHQLREELVEVTSKPMRLLYCVIRIILQKMQKRE